MEYFPDYLDGQLPDRNFMFSIIATKFPQTLAELVRDARKKRSLWEDVQGNDYIEIDPVIKSLIMNVLERKSK